MDLTRCRPTRCLTALLATTLMALTASIEAGPPAGNDWRFKLDAGALHQFDTSLDDGGDFDIDRYYLRLGASRGFGASANAGVSLGYGESRYGFSGGGFGGSEPWGTIREMRLSLPLSYRPEGNWSYFAIPSLRYEGERGAKRSKSDRWGLLAGAAYRFSDRLSIGPGLGVFSDIEDDTDVFPILLLDWKIRDDLRLETGRGLAASRGPGLTLRWSPLASWEFSLSARYEKTRFRLDKDGPVPNGVGQDKSVPLAVAASYKPNRQLELSLLAGADFAGNLRLEDADGRRLESSDYDTAPFVGLLLTLRP
jgi:hypothetical protein